MNYVNKKNTYYMFACEDLGAGLRRKAYYMLACKHLGTGFPRKTYYMVACEHLGACDHVRSCSHGSTSVCCAHVGMRLRIHMWAHTHGCNVRIHIHTSRG